MYIALIGIIILMLYLNGNKVENLPRCSAAGRKVCCIGAPKKMIEHSHDVNTSTKRALDSTISEFNTVVLNMKTNKDNFSSNRRRRRKNKKEEKLFNMRRPIKENFDKNKPNRISLHLEEIGKELNSERGKEGFLGHIPWGFSPSTI